MNAKLTAKTLVVASIAALFATASFADNSAENDAPEFHAPSVKTRADVLGELQQARANGELRSGDGDSFVRPTATVSTRTRAEVRAEVIKALQAGERFSQGDRG